MPDDIKRVCRACLAAEAVTERYGVRVPVTEPPGLIAEGDTGGFEQGGMGSTQAVPAHSRAVQVIEGGDQGEPGLPVVATYRKVELIEDLRGALGQGHDTDSGARLGRVDSPGPVGGALDADDMTVYVAWLYGDDLAPAQPGEHDELGNGAPDARHAPDHLLDLDQAERRSPWHWRWDAYRAFRER